MFNALFSEAVRAAELQPVASIGPDADALLSEVFVDTDLAAAQDRLDAAQAEVSKHDRALAAALESAAGAVDSPKDFAVADSELRRQELIHKRLTDAVATAHTALAAR